MLLEFSSGVVDCSWYELEVDVLTLELASIDGRTVYGVVVAVTADNVVNSLLVACSDIGVCDENELLLMLVEDCVDAYIEVLTLVIGWTDEVSKVDVMIVELWSEIDDDVVISMVVICVDDDTEGTDTVSVELETPFIVVVSTSVTNRVLVWGNNWLLVVSEVIIEIDSVSEVSLRVAVLAVSPVESVIVFVSANVDGVANSIFVVNSRDDCRVLWELCVSRGRRVDVTKVRVLSVSIDDTVVVGMNTDVRDCVFELWNWKLVVFSSVADFEYKVESTIDTFVVALVSVSGDDVMMTDIFSVVLIVFSLVVLEISFIVVEINWFVDNSDSSDEVRSPWELNRVVNTDVSDEIDSLFDEVPVAMDNSCLCVWYDDTSGIVVTIVDVDISDDEDKDEYLVELMRFSFVIEIEVNNDSVDSE